MTLFTPGRRPTIGEIRAYYSRPEILNEILQALQRWHVSFVPGYAKQSWVYTEDAAELHTMLMQPLDLMEENPERTEYPYFRINWERHSPAHAWDADTLLGHDFVIEKDAYLWQECFEATMTVMDLLDSFGVYHWVKYTGHHSLHLIIPAECFPRVVRGVPLSDVYEPVYSRLMIFLNKRAPQYFNENDRHCPPGTNMPYSVNEDTGLANTPLLREELATFKPWHASIHLTQPRDFWRTVPPSAYGSAAGLLAEVLKPFGAQSQVYPTGKKINRRFFTAEDAKNAENSHGAHRINPSVISVLSVGNSSSLDSADVRERRCAAWMLMVSGDASAVPALITALADADADVRWFAAEALARFGPPEALPALLALPSDDMAGASFVDFCVRHGAPTVPALIEALKAGFKSMWVSLPVDRALERIGEAARPALEALLADSDSAVRKHAAAILDRLAGTPALEAVLARSRSHSRRWEAAQMLGWYDDPAALERLTELVSDRDARARKDALKSLLWCDHPETESLLRGALADSDAKVRRWAERELAHFAVIKPLLKM